MHQKQLVGEKQRPRARNGRRLHKTSKLRPNLYGTLHIQRPSSHGMNEPSFPDTLKQKKIRFSRGNKKKAYFETVANIQIKRSGASFFDSTFDSPSFFSVIRERQLWKCRSDSADILRWEGIKEKTRRMKYKERKEEYVCMYLERERVSSESMLELTKSTYLESNSARFRNATRRSSLISSWGDDWTTTTTSLMFLGRIADLAMQIAVLTKTTLRLWNKSTMAETK